MNKSNLLIGAVSTNYSIQDIQGWVNSSDWEDCERILLVYNSENRDDQLSEYLETKNVMVFRPDFDFWGRPRQDFNSNTGVCNLDVSYDLVHNIRFFHIWNLLNNEQYEKVLITDVRDVFFNKNPFDQLSADKITATNENILYKTDQWNTDHLHYTLGIIGLTVLLDKPVYNVGVFGGSYELVKEMCADIYLIASGKQKVADQTAFNYLIQTKYKNLTDFTDDIAAHLHVVSTGLAQFDFSILNEYSILHQYDRFPELKQYVEKLYE
jgi:hypothetical protein